MKHLLYTIALLGLFTSTGFAETTIGAEKKEEVVTPAVDATTILDVQPYDRILGDENAPITIVEYASLSCPHCASFHNDVLPELTEKYIDTGKARLLARNFPTNEPALRGSMLTMCVDEDQYYTFQKVLYRMQKKWAFALDFKESLKTISRVGGVSDDDFDTCMANEDIEKQALEIRRTAGENLDIQATPTFYINGEKLQGSGTIEGFSELIDKHLAKK